MAFDGRWKAVEFSGAAAYVAAINSPDEYKQKLAKLAEALKTNPDVYIEELKVTADSVHRTVLINGEARKDSGEVKIGVEHDGHSGDGRPAKVKIVRESDNKLVLNDRGDGFTSVSTFEVSGNTMTVTAVANGATFHAKFQRA